MKLAVVSLVRNEGDIIQTFLGHITGLFDYAIIVDHGSIDGTNEIITKSCALRNFWIKWTLGTVGYHQDRVCTLALQYLMENTDADFVFFLDADEFIDVPNRAALEKQLSAIRTDEDVGILRWRNCVPERLDVRIFRHDESVLASSRPSEHCKVIVSRKFYSRSPKKIRMRTGNHGIECPTNLSIAYRELGELLHVPIRSLSHFEFKVIAGVLSNLARSDRDPGDCAHWHSMAQRIAHGKLTEEDVLGVAARYGLDPSEWTPISLVSLRNQGFSRRLLPIIGELQDTGTGGLDANNMARLVASIIQSWHPEDLARADLVLDGSMLTIKPRATQADDLALYVTEDGTSNPTSASSNNEIRRLRQELASTQQRLLYSEKVRRDMQESISFRITSPLRIARRLLQSIRR